MNQKPFITIGSTTINTMSLVSVIFSDEENSVEINLERSEHKFKFADDKEFQRIKTYIRMMSTQFESAEEIPAEDRKKTILG